MQCLFKWCRSNTCLYAYVRKMRRLADEAHNHAVLHPKPTRWPLGDTEHETQYKYCRYRSWVAWSRHHKQICRSTLSLFPYVCVNLFFFIGRDKYFNAKCLGAKPPSWPITFPLSAQLDPVTYLYGISTQWFCIIDCPVSKLCTFRCLSWHSQWQP